MSETRWNPALMDVALAEAQQGFDEGGVPVGACIATFDGKILGRGHNRRMQDGDPTCHGETAAARAAGRQDYTKSVLYTTLAPCAYCVELVLLLRIPVVVVGESRTFPGMPERLRSAGIEVHDLDDPRCVALMERMIRERPALWNEDIGVEEGGSEAYRR